MRTWVRSVHRLLCVSSRPRPASRKRPAVESLEDRCVPASTGYTQLDLVSDQANTALVTDSNLVDAWGIGLSPTGGNFWVANNVPSVATQYAGAVNGSPFTRHPLVVQIPFGGPSGVVFNGTNDFGLANGSPAQFLVSQETAWAAGWNPSLQPATDAQAVIDTVFTGAVYKGLAIAQNGTANLLYLTNIHAGTIEVYDTQFHAVTLAGHFTDPTTTVPLPADFAPFNIANIGGQLYVTYAKQNANKDGEVPGPGHGFLDVFNPDGTFVKRLVSNGPLNSPWGLALAPSNFGDLSGDLLVGNFGDGAVNAFNPTTGASAGSLKDAAGSSIHIDGLWALQFGNGVSAGDSNVLYFSAGPAGETHGLFGSLHANGTNPLTGTGSGTLAGTAGTPLSGVLATFADTTPGLTANDFNVTITINGVSSTGVVTANSNGTGFFVTGPNTNPSAGTDQVTITIQEKAHPSASLTVNAQATVTTNQLDEIFVQGLDNQVYAQKLDSTGLSASGYFLAAPGALRSFVAGHDGNNHLELFGLGLDNQVYALHFDASGNGKGGYFRTAPGAVQSFTIGYDASNHPEVFALGLDSQVYASQLDANGNPASGYFLTHSGAVKSFAVGHDAANRPELFALGLDNQVYAQKFDGNGNSISGYSLTSAGAVLSVSVGSDAGGDPELFVQGLDHQVYAQKLDAGGTSTGPYFLAAPGAIRSFALGHDAANRPELFAIGLDNQVYEALFDSTGMPLPGGYHLTRHGSVKALSVHHTLVNTPELFVLGLDDQVYGQQLDGTGSSVSDYFFTQPGRVKALGVT